MNKTLNKFTLEEIYLIKTCNLKTPDRDRIIKELNGYLDLAWMEEIIGKALDKIEKATEKELQELWEFSLD